MSGEGKTDGELWGAFLDLDEDLLRSDSPIDDVHDVLRIAGADPEVVGRRGAALVAKLAKARRLSWQERARRRLADMASTASRQLHLDLAGDQLRAAIERARAHPAVGGDLAAAFRNRKEGEMTDEERRSLLADMEAVIAMAEEDQGGQDP